MVGESIRNSAELNGAYECRYVNLSTSSSLGEIGRASLGKVVSFARIRKAVLRELMAFRPDAVYVTASSTGLGFIKDSLIVNEIKRKGFPVILHFHNKGFLTGNRYVPDKYIRHFFEGVDVIQLSEKLYPDISRYVPRSRVYFCPNGRPEPEVVRRAEHSVPHILFLSNLIESKGILVLLDACKILKDRCFRFVLDIAGGETEAISAERLQREISARSLEDIAIWHGRVGGAVKDGLYGSADIFTLPTFNDAFPLVVLEAMANSLPVVSTDEGGITDMVVDGENGRIVPRKDASALADALGDLLRDKSLRQRMGEDGRSRYERMFTEEAFLRRFVDIIDTIVQ